MRFELVSSHVSHVNAQRFDAVATATANIQLDTQHGFSTGTMESDKGDVFFAILSIKFKVHQRNEQGQDNFTVDVAHEVVFRTAALLSPEEVANANVMAPMVHSATGIAFAGTIQILRLLGSRATLKYPDVAPSFELDSSLPKFKRQLAL